MRAVLDVLRHADSGFSSRAVGVRPPSASDVVEFLLHIIVIRGRLSQFVERQTWSEIDAVFPRDSREAVVEHEFREPILVRGPTLEGPADSFGSRFRFRQCGRRRAEVGETDHRFVPWAQG